MSLPRQPRTRAQPRRGDTNGIRGKCNPRSYNRIVSRRVAALLCGMSLLAACGQDIRSKEKVQEAILNRLQTHSGLDLKALDVATTSVSFDRNMAYATVAFHPKGDSSLNGGMVMKYTLENRNGKWVVVRVGDSHARSVSGALQSGASELPPGHPPVQPMNSPPAPHQGGGVAQ